MHSAPAGPGLPARAAGLLARLRFRAAALLGPLGILVLVLRRTRLLPVTLAALALGSFVVAAPLTPYDDDARSTAALSSTSGGGQELVPATGDGWTQDGAPVVTSPSGSDEEPASSASRSSPSGSPSSSSTPSSSPTRSSSGSSSSEPSSPGSASRAAVEATEESEPPATGRSTTESSRASSPGNSSPSSSSSTAQAPSSEPEPSETLSDTVPAAPEAATTGADPAGEVLAVVNTARTAAGCAALTADAGLASLAARHSAAMRDGGSPPDGASRTAVVATGTDPAAVADDLLADAALLDCSLTTAGVGTTDGFWTLLAA